MTMNKGDFPDDTFTENDVLSCLEWAGLQPGFLVGGVPLNFGVSARLGAPTLPAARGSLPPEGAGLAWGGPARRPA